jgi:hypothetical protein
MKFVSSEMYADNDIIPLLCKYNFKQNGRKNVATNYLFVLALTVSACDMCYITGFAI